MTQTKNDKAKQTETCLYGLQMFIMFKQNVIWYQLSRDQMPLHVGSGHENIKMQGTYKEGSSVSECDDFLVHFHL